MSSKQGKNVFKSILLTSKVLGVFPFDEDRVRISPSWALYSFILIGLCCAEMALILFNPPETSKFSAIHNFLYKCQMVALSFCMIMFNVFVYAKRSRLAELFKELDFLRSSSAEKEPRFASVIFHLSIQALVVVSTGACDIYANRPLGKFNVIALTYYYAMITVISTGTLPFVSVLEVVHCKFVYMTNKMRNLLKLTAAQYYLGDLLRFVHHYNRSVNILANLNDVFSFQLLFLSFISFLNVTTNMYYIVDYIVDIKLHKLEVIDRTDIMPVFAGWIIIFSSLIGFPIYSCQRIVHQAKEFNSLLYQLMIDDNTNDVANNKKLRLHLSIKREVVFTACGFFSLDYTLLHSMIAAATTYLVILVQFGEHNTRRGSPSNTS